MPNGSISPLAIFLPDRATPELQLLYVELGFRHCFREAARDGLVCQQAAIDRTAI